MTDGSSGLRSDPRPEIELSSERPTRSLCVSDTITRDGAQLIEIARLCDAAKEAKEKQEAEFVKERTVVEEARTKLKKELEKLKPIEKKIATLATQVQRCGSGPWDRRLNVSLVVSRLLPPRSPAADSWGRSAHRSVLNSPNSSASRSPLPRRRRSWRRRPRR